MPRGDFVPSMLHLLSNLDENLRWERITVVWGISIRSDLILGPNWGLLLMESVIMSRWAVIQVVWNIVISCGMLPISIELAAVTYGELFVSMQLAAISSVPKRKVIYMIVDVTSVEIIQILWLYISSCKILSLCRRLARCFCLHVR